MQPPFQGWQTQGWPQSNGGPALAVPLDEPALEAPTDAVPDREVAVAAPETLAP